MSASEDLLALQRDFNAVFGTLEGVRVLDHILNKLCGMSAVTMRPEPGEAEVLLGARNVGTAILNIMNKPVREIAELRRRRGN